MGTLSVRHASGTIKGANRSKNSDRFRVFSLPLFNEANVHGAVICDGASDAPRSDAGAADLAAVVEASLAEHLPRRREPDFWISTLRNAVLDGILAAAGEHTGDVELDTVLSGRYSCTIAGVLIDDDYIWFFRWGSALHAAIDTSNLDFTLVEHFPAGEPFPVLTLLNGQKLRKQQTRNFTVKRYPSRIPRTGAATFTTALVASKGMIPLFRNPPEWGSWRDLLKKDHGFAGDGCLTRYLQEAAFAQADPLFLTDASIVAFDLKRA